MPDLTVDLNPYRWNRRANIVWLESPAGVGFSSPESDFDPYYNDETTTERSYEFLKHFFDRYPSLKGRDFYIAGESYAGIYIPALVDKLVENPLPGVHLKGFTIGNPFTDAEIDGNAYMDYFYSHAMISLENYDRMVKFCASEIGQCMYTSKNCSKECSQSVQEGLLDSDTDQLNPYYIYGDKCMLKNSQAGMLRYTTKKNPISPEFRQRSEIGPCTDEFTQTYLNLPTVQVRWCHRFDRTRLIQCDRMPSMSPTKAYHGLIAIIELHRSITEQTLPYYSIETFYTEVRRHLSTREVTYQLG